MLKKINQKVNYTKVLVFCFFCFSSCKHQIDETSKKIIGQWDIYEFTYNKQDHKNDLLMNFIIFDKGGTFSIPEIFDSYAEDAEDGTKWEIQNNDSLNEKYLILNCKNNFFKGKYKIIFFKDFEKKLLGIKLSSEKTYIMAYKALQDFDSLEKGW